jgi:zinc transport system substrate-binding protein
MLYYNNSIDMLCYNKHISLETKTKGLSMRFALALCLAALPQITCAEVPQIVTDIPPVQALVAQVMGSLGTPSLLLEKGADEHDFQLRPSQMQSIADADLVIWIGPALTPWLDRALQGTDTKSFALLTLYATKTQDFAAGDPEESSLDPHAWMNPENAQAWLTQIALRLSQFDPANAATYKSNAETARQRIAAMDGEITKQLAHIANRPFVTFHAAYGYFTQHYGLNSSALALGDASAPGAAKLSKLQSQLQSATYACAFPEVQHDPALLTQLMQGSQTKLGAALDPVGSSLPFGPDAYDVLMRSIANSLTDCLNP